MPIVLDKNRPIMITKKIFEDDRIDFELLGFYCTLIYECEKQQEWEIDLSDDEVSSLMKKLMEYNYVYSGEENRINLRSYF